MEVLSKRAYLGFCPIDDACQMARCLINHNIAGVKIAVEKDYGQRENVFYGIKTSLYVRMKSSWQGAEQ
jgi:hypothetical protein